MDHADIIALWPSIRSFAEDIGVPRNTAKQMNTRGRIAAHHWQGVVRAAMARGFSDVTIEALTAGYQTNHTPDPARIEFPEGERVSVEEAA